jgi:hypothetical protein
MLAVFDLWVQISMNYFTVTGGIFPPSTVCDITAFCIQKFHSKK